MSKFYGFDNFGSFRTSPGPGVAGNGFPDLSLLKWADSQPNPCPGGPFRGHFPFFCRGQNARKNFIFIRVFSSLIMPRRFFCFSKTKHGHEVPSQSPDLDENFGKSYCGTKRVRLRPPLGPGRPRTARKFRKTRNPQKAEA